MLDKKDLTYLEVVKPMDSVKLNGETYRAGEEERTGDWVKIRGWARRSWEIIETEGEITGIDYKENVIAISGDEYNTLMLNKIISIKKIKAQKRTQKRVLYYSSEGLGGWSV